MAHRLRMIPIRPLSNLVAMRCIRRHQLPQYFRSRSTPQPKRRKYVLHRLGDFRPSGATSFSYMLQDNHVRVLPYTNRRKSLTRYMDPRVIKKEPQEWPRALKSVPRTPGGIQIGPNRGPKGTPRGQNATPMGPNARAERDKRQPVGPKTSRKIKNVKTQKGQA